LEDYGLSTCSTVGTPMVEKVTVSEDSSDDPLDTKRSPFLQMIRKLL
jgi:hypothetical protein